MRRLPASLLLSAAAIFAPPASPASKSTPAVSVPVLWASTPVYGAPLTVYSTVAPSPAGSGPAPTGTVTFKVDGGTGGTPQPLNTNAIAIVTLALGVGSHSVVASYSGDTNYLAASSQPLTFSVDLATTVLAMASNPPQINQPVAVRAAPTLVSPAAGNAGGTVDFTLGGTPIAACKALAVQSGAAVCNTTFTQLGTYTISATYNGDANTKPSSASLQLTVAKLAAGTYIASAPDSPVYGTAVTINELLLGAASTPAPTGTVTFLDGTATLGTSPVGSDGRATLTGPLNVGTHAITGTYGGDVNYQSSSASMSITVAKAATSVALTSTAGQAGQPATLKATVSITSPGSGTAGGAVSFTNGSAPIAGCTAVALQNGVASCPAGSLAAGTFTITASYLGDANTAASNATLQLILVKLTPNIYTASTPDTPTWGATVTVNALLQGATGSATPTGTVVFSDGTATIATLPVGTDGKASLVMPSGQVAPLTVGTHSIVAVYSGDANYLTVTATALSIVVGKAASTTALTATSAPMGQPVTLKATVTSAAAATGTVDFTSASKAITGCTGVTLQSGSATCGTSFAQTGTYTIAASYSGDANTTSSSATLQVTASKATAGVSTTATPASPVYGVSVTINAVVSGAVGVGAPTGTVAFSDGTNSLGTIAVGSDGRASVTVASGTLAPAGAGAKTITAVYSGDTNYATANAAPLNVTVVKAATTTQLSASFGAAFVATVTIVAPGAGTPTGSVQFLQGTTSIGTAKLTSQASAFTATLPAGTQTGSITAVYQGDSNFSGSTSTAVTVAALAQISLASDTNPSVAGQTVTFTAQLTASSGGTAPGGTVQFTSDGTALGTATIAKGAAALPVTNLAAGTHSVTASWAGDATWSAITSAAVSQTVKKAQTVTVLAPSATALNASVTVTAPGAGSPSGTVRFVDAATNAVLGTSNLTGGVASVPLPPATDAMVAVYAGDSNFLGSTSSAWTPLAAVNAASYTSAAFAPDEIVTLFGSNLAPSSVSSTGTPAATLGGTTVSLTDSGGSKHSASILFVSPSQASFLMPADMPTGTATVTVTNSSQASVSTAVPVTAVAPGLFTMSGTGQGAAAGQVVRVHADGSQDSPQDMAVFDKSQNAWVPASIDLGAPTDTVYLILYGTGLRHCRATTVTIGSQQVTAAYAGAQGMPGLDQVNVVLPQSLRGAGAVNLKITVDGTSSNTVTLAVL